MAKVTAQMSVSLDGYYAGPRSSTDPHDMASGGTCMQVKAGQGCLISKGPTVTYRGAANTKAIYVLHPIDWETRN